MIHSLMLRPCEICSFGLEQIPLEPLPHLWQEKWTRFMFFLLVSLKISIPLPPPPFWNEGTIILFVSLSTTRRFIHLIISAPLQGHYYYFYVAAEETSFLASDRAKTQDFWNSKPTFFTLHHSCLIPFHWNDRICQFWFWS